MLKLLGMTGWVLGCFLALDVVGVVLTLFADMVLVLQGEWEGRSPLGYCLAYFIWFVVGVFCALFISAPTWTKRPQDDDHGSPEGRRRGLELLVITSVAAVVLGVLSSFVWSASGAGEAVAPDHRGVTITYLVTVVLVVACARFWFFREHVRADPGSAKPDSAKPDAAEPDTAKPPFKPAGSWATVGFLIGVPVLLFLDASFFLFAPFDYFDRWMGPILSTSLGGGLAWGFASARWRSPRAWLLVLHAPQVIGTSFYVCALVPGALLVAFGVPELVSEIVSYVGLGLGFLFGCVLVVARFFVDDGNGTSAADPGSPRMRTPRCPPPSSALKSMSS